MDGCHFSHPSLSCLLFISFGCICDAIVQAMDGYEAVCKAQAMRA